jgi:hypothetical protein
MMKFLRNKTVQKRLYIVLAVAILPPFLFWGVSVSGKGGSFSSALGLIGRQKITVKDYLQSVQAVERQVEMMFGSKAGRAVPRAHLYGQAWDRILLLHYAKTKKIRASDQEVVAWISNQPLFQKQGVFDTQFYRLYVEHFRISTRTFEEEIRDTLTIHKIQESLGSAEATENLLKSLRDTLKVNAELMKEFLSAPAE